MKYMFITLLAMLFCFQAYPEEKPQQADPLQEFKGKKVASITGTVFDKLINSVIPDVTHLYFNDYTSMVEALRQEKVDAVGVDLPVGKMLENKCPDLIVFPSLVLNDKLGFACRKGDKLALEAENAIEDMRRSGILINMEKRWFSGKDELMKIPPELKKENELSIRQGVIRFAHDNVSMPMGYTGTGGESLGFDVELALRIGGALNCKVELIPMSFGGLLAALKSGKVDMVGGAMSVTPERAKSVDFAGSYYQSGIALLVRREAVVASAAVQRKKITLWDSFKTSFERTFITEDRYKLILHGLAVTIIISVLAAVLGTLMGFGVCMARRAKTLWTVIPAKAFIGVLRGTPIVVILMILYYIVFASVNINPILIAIVGFALNFAAYVSEMMRSGIEAVDKGQLEAASALGFSRFQTFRKITFPQAARYVIPVYKGEFISMLKMTSVVGYIAIRDLTKMSDIIRSRTYDAFFPLLTTAAIYFILAYIMTAALGVVEIKIDPKHRKRIVKGVVTI